MKKKINLKDETRALLTLIVILMIGGVVGFWLGTKSVDVPQCTTPDSSISVDIDGPDKKKPKPSTKH